MCDKSNNGVDEVERQFLAEGAIGGDPTQQEDGSSVDSSPGEGSQMQKQVEAELTCSICLGLFENPRALPCQHTYCENCIARLALSSSSADGRQLRCPECRKLHDIQEGGVTNFKINFKIRSLSDWMRGQQPGKCPSHLQEFDHICNTCVEPVCKKCVITTHNGHRCVSIIHFAENMLSEVRIRKEALRKAKQRVEKNLSDLNRNKDSAMRGLEQHIQNIKLVIDQAQQDLAYKITDAFHRKEANLKRQERKLQEDMEGLEDLGREDVLRELQMPTSLPLMWNTLQTKTTESSYAPCENSTLMVQWDQAMKSLGEVMPIKTTYSTRRPSITSDTSGTFSRITSLSEDPSGPLSRSTSRIDVPPTPTTPDMDMKAEVDNFAARLQRSLDSRGGPRRPLKNDQRGPKNPGQKKSALRNQGQQQNRENQEQGQQGCRNRGGPNGGKDQGPCREQNRDRLSSSSSTGKGEESLDGKPKKSRSQRRREQYRRRQRDKENGDVIQETRDAKEAPTDGKLNGHAKQEPKDSKSTNKDSQTKENNVTMNDSKRKSSTEIKDDN